MVFVCLRMHPCMPIFKSSIGGPVCFAEFLQLVKLGTFIHFVATILATVLLKYLNCSDERCHGCRVMEFILIWAVTCVFSQLFHFYAIYAQVYFPSRVTPSPLYPRVTSDEKEEITPLYSLYQSLNIVLRS